MLVDFGGPRIPYTILGAVPMHEKYRKLVEMEKKVETNNGFRCFFFVFINKLLKFTDSDDTFLILMNFH